MHPVFKSNILQVILLISTWSTDGVPAGVNTISAHRRHPGLRALTGPDHVKDLVAAFSAQFEQALLVRGFAAGWETYETDRSYNLREVLKLRVIFRDDNRDGIEEELNKLETKSWFNDDLRNPTLFPYATARVSRLWQGLVAHNPLHWIRVAFDLSAAEPPLLDAFLWSQDLPFNVVVFDSRSPSCASNPEGSEALAIELARVSAILTSLTPHLERCQSLVFDISFASSLPLLPTLLRHSGENLKELKLEYRTHAPNSIGYDMWFPSPTASRPPTSKGSSTFPSMSRHLYERLGVIPAFGKISMPTTISHWNSPNTTSRTRTRLNRLELTAREKFSADLVRLHQRTHSFSPTYPSESRLNGPLA